MSSTRYTVPPASPRSRADKVLAKAFPEHSRVAFQRALDAGLVTRNGKTIDRSAEVVGGDDIVFVFPETRPTELKAVDIPIDVQRDQLEASINKAVEMMFAEYPTRRKK